MIMNWPGRVVKNYTECFRENYNGRAYDIHFERMENLTVELDCYRLPYNLRVGAY